MTKHSLLAQQVDALLYNEPNLMANLANAAALLNDSLTDVNWVGFYLYNKSKNELDLGPFQGKVACMHIANGKGVVGTAFATQKTQVVADVHQFAGHIACDLATNAEIVVPPPSQCPPDGRICPRRDCCSHSEAADNYGGYTGNHSGCRGSDPGE